MKPRLYIYQKITAFVNRYKVHVADASGEKGELITFVQQKRGRLKEAVQFYSGEDKKNVIFTFRAEKVFDIHGKYFVEDTSGGLIGYFQKDFQKSFVQSTWHMFDAAGQPLLSVTESNVTLAVLRRYLGFVPIIGELFEIVIAFFRYHFVFLDPVSGQIVGKFEKLSIWRDNYKLSMDDATYARIDGRLITAMAVALDALQSR